MSERCIAVLLFVGVLGLLPAFAQSRTAWGDPDLEGIYTNATITPLERPAEFLGKPFLTENEIAELEKRVAQSHADQLPREGETGTYNEFWDEPGTRAVATRSSSLIIDPPDGKIPPLTAT